MKLIVFYPKDVKFDIDLSLKGWGKKLKNISSMNNNDDYFRGEIILSKGEEHYENDIKGDLMFIPGVMIRKGEIPFLPDQTVLNKISPDPNFPKGRVLQFK